MHKILLSFAVVALISTQTLIAQEKKDDKKIDVKIEKKIETKDGKDNMTTKVIIMKDGKIVAEEEGTDVRLKEVLSKAGFTEDEINNVSVKIDSDVIGSGKGRHKMMWIGDEGETMDFEFSMDGDDVMMYKKMHKANKMRSKHSAHRNNMFMMHDRNMGGMMMLGDGKVSIYDYSKSDKETKAFKAKQGKKISFKSIEINSMGKGIHLLFEAEKKPLLVTVKDANGKKIFYSERSEFDGEFNSRIPMMNAEKGIYLLEVKVGDKNWLQKLVVE